MAKAGRPPKYGPEIHAAICQNLEMGCSKTTAAELNGITRQTIWEWDEKYAPFSYDMRTAIAKAKRRATVTITTAISQGDTNAAFRYLALMERDEWREQRDVSVAISGELTIRQAAEQIAAEVGLTAEEVIHEAERILKVSRS